MKSKYINIVSRSVYQFHPSGPKKLVSNVIAGLKLLNIPFTVNGDPRHAEYNWIHDDRAAFHLLNELYKAGKISGDQNFVFGPNIFQAPTDMQTSENEAMNITSKFPYIMPAEWVEVFWRKRGYKGKSLIWPVGIDTYKFIPNPHPAIRKTLHPRWNHKKSVLVYVKNRDKKDVRLVIDELEKQNIPFKILEYGAYQEERFMELVRDSKYCILLVSSESQGIAIEEMMSMGLPLLVFDIQNFNQREALTNRETGIYNQTSKSEDTDDPATSIPYFDKNCGLIFNQKEKISDFIKMMENEYDVYNPREYVLNNLSLEKQSLELVRALNFPEPQSYSNKYKEKIKFSPKKSWRNRTWLRPFLFIKHSLLFLRWVFSIKSL